MLVATGRRSNTDLLGPDHGIETDERGFFTIDSRFQTSVNGVWALGDVNGHGAFTHTAYQDGQILLHPPRTVDGRVTLYALYTDPPLGRVGMTVSEARASGRNVLKAEVQIIGTAMQAGVPYPTVHDQLPIHPTMAEFIPSALWSLKPLD